MDAYYPFDSQEALQTKEDFKKYEKFINDWITRDFDYCKKMADKFHDHEHAKSEAAKSILLYEKRRLHLIMMLAKHGLKEEGLKKAC